LSASSYIRLSELSEAVYRIVEDVFSTRAFWVIADVTSHSYKPGKNHHYFDLVEKDPASSAIIAKFATRAWTDGSGQIGIFEQTTGQRFTNDINVLVLVSVSYHPVFGLQLTLHDIDTSFTLGTLEKQKQATLMRLIRDNPDHVRLEDQAYITFNQELELPRVLQHIAVISSSTSAGYEDFLHSLENNDFGYAFRIDPYFTVVQGESNAQYIVDKLIEIYRSGKSYDAVVIIRGGGAQTDLLLFEQYAIGRAIARFPVPVITGIGHQKNETVADLMAHTAVKTPTKAAEFIISRNREFHDDVLSLEKNIIIRAQQIVAWQRQELAQKNQEITSDIQTLLFGHGSALQNLAGRLLRKPGLLLYQKQCGIDSLVEKLRLNSHHYLKNEANKLENISSLVKMIAPENVLRKGFAVVKYNGQAIAADNQITTGSEIDIILAGQEFSATVTTQKKS